MIDELHAQHFKVALHVVIEGRRMAGTVSEPCTPDKAMPSGRTPDMAPATAAGLEHGGVRSVGDRVVLRRCCRSGSCGAPQPARGACSQEVSRAPVPAVALHLHGCAGVLRYRAADDARSLASPSGRRTCGETGRPVSLGARHSRVTRRRARRDHSTVYLPRGTWFDF
jgi:hypothetical protein